MVSDRVLAKTMKVGRYDLPAHDLRKYLLRLMASFAPVVAATIVIFGYGNSDNRFFVLSSTALESLNRIGQNAYPLASAALLLLLAAFMTTLISFCFYLNDFWTEVWRSSEQQRSGWHRLAFASLIINGALLVAFWVVVFLVILGVRPINDGDGWVPELLTIGRYLAVFVFLLFLFGDVALYRSQSTRLASLQGATNERARAEHENDMLLVALSIAMIDLPGLVTATFAVALIEVIKRNPAFHLARSMNFPMHAVSVPLSETTFELGLYGLEAGILAATLLTSQVVFSALMTRWAVRRSESNGGPQ